MSDEVAVDGYRRPVRRADAATSSWRKARAVELALAGLAYDDIAVEVGYANRGTAWRVVQQALHERKIKSVDEYRALELARLDALQSAHWTEALSGQNLKAAELCLRISAQRTKLLGLDSLIPGEQPSTSIVIGGTKAEYIAGLKQITAQ